MWVCPQVSLWEIQTRIMPLSSFASHHADGRNRTCIAFQCVPPLWFGQESNAGLIMSGVCVCVSVRRYQSWWEVCLVLPWVTAKEEKMLAEHVVWNPLTAPGGGSRSLCVCVCVWLYTLACIAKLNSNKQVIWLYNRITKRNCNEVGLQ